MSADKPQPVVKKKIKPYPFEATLEINGVKKPVEVIYLTPAGLIARLKGPAIVQVGEYYQTVFELPVLHNFVNTKVRVIKTYDRSVDAKALQIDRMAEVHFEALDPDHRKNILSFVSRDRAEVKPMRVISGKYRGHHLVDFQAGNIRPTTDRVKETLFNKLMGRIEGARILDMFSGTGNLAIECISREAAWVDLVENHRKSLNIIKENMAKLKITDGFKIYPIDAFKYIKEFDGEPYDVVICDPPFTQALADDLGRAIAVSKLLAPGAWVVIEASSKETIQDTYENLVRFDQRTFGDKSLNFFARPE